MWRRMFRIVQNGWIEDEGFAELTKSVEGSVSGECQQLREDGCDNYPSRKSGEATSLRSKLTKSQRFGKYAKAVGRQRKHGTGKTAKQLVVLSRGASQILLDVLSKMSSRPTRLSPMVWNGLN